MPNAYFRFKQFIIHQDRCVMKVCTDSCILGAWTALRLQGVKTLLDIGSGTGLLPLMLAQQSMAVMDTIESDPASCEQARENIQASPWSDRIRLLEGDVRDYFFPSNYDFIITNPPFFEADLQSPNPKKNKAKHEESLTFEELLEVISKNLQEHGAFTILLPHHRSHYFETLATGRGFFVQEKLTVYQTPKHTPFRSIYLFSRNQHAKIVSDEMTMKDSDGKNSETFVELLKDFYEKL
jgi:tRNA1Val (adenine37-N6)-methyltransferase